MEKSTTMEEGSVQPGGKDGGKCGKVSRMSPISNSTINHSEKLKQETPKGWRRDAPIPGDEVAADTRVFNQKHGCSGCLRQQ